MMGNTRKFSDCAALLNMSLYADNYAANKRQYKFNLFTFLINNYSQANMGIYALKFTLGTVADRVILRKF